MSTVEDGIDFGLDPEARERAVDQVAQELQDMDPTALEEVVDGEVSYAVVPYTGEALSLPDLSEEQLGEVLDRAREFERAQLSVFKREVQDEILRRMDQAAARGETGPWTMHLPGGITLQGDSPDRSDYDLEKLRKTLEDLAERKLVEGDCCPECGRERGVLALVIVPERYKVAKRAVSQLLKIGGEVKEAIEACRVESTKPRTVRVTRST